MQVRCIYCASSLWCHCTNTCMVWYPNDTEVMWPSFVMKRHKMYEYCDINHEVRHTITIIRSVLLDMCINQGKRLGGSLNTPACDLLRKSITKSCNFRKNALSSCWITIEHLRFRPSACNGSWIRTSCISSIVILEYWSAQLWRPFPEMRSSWQLCMQFYNCNRRI